MDSIRKAEQALTCSMKATEGYPKTVRRTERACRHKRRHGLAGPQHGREGGGR